MGFIFDLIFALALFTGAGAVLTSFFTRGKKAAMWCGIVMYLSFGLAFVIAAVSLLGTMVSILFDFGT